MGQDGKIGRYVKPVRRGGRLYLYLAEMTTTANGGRQERVIRRVNEEEARGYGWKGEFNGQNQTVELEEHEAPSARSLESESARPNETLSTLTSTTTEALLKEAGKEQRFIESHSTRRQAATEADKHGFTVVPRSDGFYVLEPLDHNLEKQYLLVTKEGRVFCSKCPRFNCGHVTFIHDWLRAHKAKSEFSKSPSL